MNKKLVLVIIVALVLSLSGLSTLLLTSPPRKKTKKIRYGGQYYPGEFLLLGKPEFWEKYGLKVEHILFSSGSENNEALISGKIDINCGSEAKTIALFNAIPKDALIIGVVQRGNRYSTVVRVDSPYHSWKDLTGKTVATRLGTGAEYVLRKYFEQVGLKWEDFNWVNLKVEDMIAALEKGQIEAFTAWEPTPSIAEAKGIGRVMRTYGDVDPVPAFIHTTKHFAYSNRDVVVKFLAAHLDKAEMITENPHEAAEIASQAAKEMGINVSSEAFEKVFKRINFSIDFNKELIDKVYDAANFLYEQGKIDKIPKLAWDRSFVEQAEQLRGK